MKEIKHMNWETLLQSCCNAESEVEYLENIIEILYFKLEDMKENKKISDYEIYRLGIALKLTELELR